MLLLLVRVKLGDQVKDIPVSELMHTNVVDNGNYYAEGVQLSGSGPGYGQEGEIISSPFVGRTSWYFIPHSLKIFLTTRLEVGAQRIFKDLATRNEAKDLRSIEDVIASLRRRTESDTYRYQKYFSIDVYNPKNFDWILDTSDLTEEEVYEQVSGFVMAKLKDAEGRSL
jgi:hypothetical protein